MSTESTATDFDPDVSAAALCGTWRFPDTDEPTGIGLLHFTDTGRAIQIISDPQRPEKCIPLKFWYWVESPTQLRLRPKPDHDGWLRDYRFDGGTMIFRAGSRSWVCTRPSPDEIPGWFHQSLAAVLAQP